MIRGMVGQSDNGLITYAQFDRRSRWPRLSRLGRQLSDWHVAKWLLVVIVVVIDIAMYRQILQRPSAAAAVPVAVVAPPKGVITAAPRIAMAASGQTPVSAKPADRTNPSPGRVSLQLQIDGQVQEFAGEWVMVQSGTRQYFYDSQSGRVRLSTTDSSSPRTSSDDDTTDAHTFTVRTPTGAFTFAGDFEAPKLPGTE